MFLNLLYDFYGELLTKHQRNVFVMHFSEDLSLSEICEQIGTTKQAVSDILRRTEKKLRWYEEKLRLVQQHVSSEENQNGI